YTLGAAIRPLAFRGPVAHTAGTRLTFSFDAFFPEGQSRDENDWRMAGELELLRGISLTAARVGDQRYQFGFVIRLPGTSGGANWSAVPPGTKDEAERAAAANGQPAPASALADRSTYSLSFHSGEEPTVLIPAHSKRVAHLEISGTLGDEDLTEISLFGGAGGQSSIEPVRRELDRAVTDPLTHGVLLAL